MTISKQDMKQLMYVFSHDLRNPLVNMRALIQDTRMSLAETAHDIEAVQQVMQDELPDNLTMMEEVVSRMNTLIAGANDIYHCMFDDVVCEDVDVEALVRQSIARRADDIQLAHIHMEIEGLGYIWADPLALRKMIMEILDNAIRHSKKEGIISWCLEKRDGLNVLVVSDQGVGIHASDLAHIFQPFFTTEHKASGMGLAVVKALVQAHDGKVWCESVEGEGSTFYIGLPDK